MTFEELRTSVVYNLGNRNNPETLAMILFQTNFLIEWLAAQQEWEDLETVVSGTLSTDQYAYTLAELSLTDSDRILAFKVYDGSTWSAPLTPVTRSVWNRDYLSYVTSSTGQPTIFCRFGGYIYVARTPDEGYTVQIDYYKQPAKVADESSTLPFSNMDGLFTATVTALTWLSLGEREMFDSWWKLAVPMISAFNMDSGRLLGGARPNRKPRTVQDPWTDPFNKRG